VEIPRRALLQKSSIKETIFFKRDLYFERGLLHLLETMIIDP